MIELLLSLLALICGLSGVYYHKNAKEKKALLKMVQEQKFESKKDEINDRVDDTTLANIVNSANDRYSKHRKRSGTD